MPPIDVFQKSRFIYIELHHIITGPKLKEFEKGNILDFSGDTFWHSNEQWHWKGRRGNDEPRARLIGHFEVKDPKLQYTGAHEHTAYGKLKGTFHHSGPLTLYVDKISHNGTKPVYFVQRVV